MFEADGIGKHNSRAAKGNCSQPSCGHITLSTKNPL